MRNKYGGYCYYCKKYVAPKQGHFERDNNSWRVIHAECVLKQRKEKWEKYGRHDKYSNPKYLKRHNLNFKQQGC